MVETATEPAPIERVEPSVDQLAAALAAVQAEIPRVIAAEEADAGSYSYKYADLAAVSAAILPLLGRNGLAFTAWPTINEQGKFVLRYELLHKSGQSKAGEYPISGGNAQAVGSAITYARRYALCAVTGVAPDEDDDAAAAVGAREVEQAEQQAENDRERHAALDAVRGAWFNQYGEWNPTAAAEMFEKWSHGATVAAANAKQLKSFAGYLHTLPVADAGSTPDEPEPPTEDGVREAPADRPINARQRGKIFALFEDLGMKEDRQRQLEYLTSVLGRQIKSRGDLLTSDADPVIKALEEDLAEARRTGLAPSNVSGSAPAAQSAAGESRVPAGPDTPTQEGES